MMFFMSDYIRKECPVCGAVGKDLSEVDDYTKVLYYFGDYKRMYAKKNVCTQCKYEW